jgi:hypothetical protein
MGITVWRTGKNIGFSAWVMLRTMSTSRKRVTDIAARAALPKGKSSFERLNAYQLVCGSG